MPYFRKTGLALLVGLTAISTLFAGTTHFVCRCPNGRVKLFCLSSPSGTTTCCCDGSCCGSTDGIEKTGPPGPCGAKAEGGCCRGAQHGDDETGAAPGAVFSAQGNCCTKTLVVAETQSLPKSEAASSGGIHFLKWATPETGAPFFLPVSEPPNTRWETFRVPPPTDLITVLQRLTI